ncbi:uncharacterized protein EI90DRAFT_3130251 [Cantharellus anzutake]|uniref:uncharacterized protein n=1 Tax=Cantharellus anzutake TaxID=1750568 RepID=UPI00190571AB|nr:uncharacterized protein EI90DRAFT_3130251 [Cantharellus anzutake]KAF8323612.1 hypothetical protein EI90DRAFT_3130251 [Cantharellus anzutake]
MDENGHLRPHSRNNNTWCGKHTGHCYAHPKADWSHLSLSNEALNLWTNHICEGRPGVTLKQPPHHKLFEVGGIKCNSNWKRVHLASPLHVAKHVMVKSPTVGPSTPTHAKTRAKHVPSASPLMSPNVTSTHSPLVDLNMTVINLMSSLPVRASTSTTCVQHQCPIKQQSAAIIDIPSSPSEHLSRKHHKSPPIICLDSDSDSDSDSKSDAKNEPNADGNIGGQVKVDPMELSDDELDDTIPDILS